MALQPYSTERKHIRVARDGLRVGRRVLPAHEIGRCMIVPALQAKTAALRFRHEGMKIGRGSYNFMSTEDPAVLVEQRRPGMRRPGWLVATNDPDALLNALQTLRGASRP